MHRIKIVSDPEAGYLAVQSAFNLFIAEQKTYKGSGCRAESLREARRILAEDLQDDPSDPGWLSPSQAIEIESRRDCESFVAYFEQYLKENEPNSTIVVEIEEF